MENNTEKITQSEQEKRDIQTLRSGNKGAILDTIKKLRTRGRLSILNELFELMLISDDEEILEASRKLLNDLKNKEAAAHIIDAIKDPKFKPLQKDLVASCWQNGLDYHEFMDVFIDVAIDADYATTLEAFTVIEDGLADAGEELRTKCIRRLEENLVVCPAEKKPLLQELLAMIDSFQEPV